MTNRKMFFTMLWGAVFRRRSRAMMAVIASLVGAATLFCLASVCVAVPQQMNEEMRAYGANLIVTPASATGKSQGIDTATVRSRFRPAMKLASYAGSFPIVTFAVSAAFHPSVSAMASFTERSFSSVSARLSFAPSRFTFACCTSSAVAEPRACCRTARSYIPSYIPT